MVPKMVALSISRFQDFSDDNAKFRKMLSSSVENIHFSSGDHILLSQLNRYIFHLRTERDQNSESLYSVRNAG
jgi:hypothetical protein